MLYLIYRKNEHDRNSSGVHCCLVEAESETEARSIALRGALTGESVPKATWPCINLDLATLGEPAQLGPALTWRELPNPLWFDGDAISLIGFRGA